MKLISECSGLPLNEPFTYLLEESKTHGDPKNFVSAMTQYSSAKGRQKNMSPEDLEYAKKALDSELMQIFHYKHEVNLARMSRGNRGKARRECDKGAQIFCELDG
jgi:hypothetical protein